MEDADNAAAPDNESEFLEFENKPIFFSHDTNATLDSSIRIMVFEFGISSYGIWWVIIELLAITRGYKLRNDRIVDTLYPLVQGKPLKGDWQDGCMEGYKDLNGQDVLYEDVGRLLIPREYLVALINRMFSLGLLQTDNKFIWSKSLNHRMAIMKSKAKAKINAKREAGKKSGESRRARKAEREKQEREMGAN
ncbi:MAG: DUF4373 domain-containing protein [Desulfobulbaceae bacterium]|nr:DUF4373 domain-containing protein [Desulfobulbaceae bacterium]